MKSALALALLVSVAAPSANATFPGGNGRIVFVSNRAASTSGPETDGDLYTIGPGGKRVTTITANESFELYPRWSPGGKRIAFSRYGRVYAIYVMRADRSGTRKITSPSGANDLFPTWSPSGRRVAFVRQPANSKGYLAGRIYVVNADGTHLRRITAEPGEYAGLAWSPDGSRFAYTRQLYLYVMRADGSGAQRLAPSLTNVTGFSWSPDGLRLAAAEDLYPRYEIDVVNADGSGDETVLVPDVRAADLAWSPDGKKLAYRTTDFRIAVADIATGASRVLETGPGAASSPDWQPLR